MELDDGPLMELQATSEEVAAVESVIAHYLNYVENLPTMTKEEKETVMLLTRLRKRLSPSTETDEDATPSHYP